MIVTPVRFSVICGFLVNLCWAQNTPNYFCGDLNPQAVINVYQLMGMWYGIEIISHYPPEEDYIDPVPSCPIIHISEDRMPVVPTDLPLHKNYNYDYNYGHGHGDYKNMHFDSGSRSRSGGGYDNVRSTTNNYANDENTFGYRNVRRYKSPWKYLRLWWDENGSSTEFRLKYNESKPGFWVSSGPQADGAALDPQYSHFGGVVQVIKAVGDHVVLTFCNGLPERTLYTVILSRDNYLDSRIIEGVHNLLHRRTLSTSNIRKVCNSSPNLPLPQIVLLVFTSLSVLYRHISS